MKRPGQLVITKSGKRGRTYNDDLFHEGKVKVYLEGEKKFQFESNGILCDPKTLKSIGFID